MSDSAKRGAASAALAAKVPEDLGLGRYEVHLAEGRVELRVRRDPWKVATVVRGIGAAVALLAPLAAIGADRKTGMLAAVGAGFGAGPTAGRLAVAGVLWLLLHVGIQLLALRAMRASLLRIALQVYEVAPELDLPRR